MRPAARLVHPAGQHRQAAGAHAVSLQDHRRADAGDPAVQKLLEDAGIKLDSVVTDVLGVSSRRMLEALIAGERDPEVLAEMALTRMRPKIGVLREALVGRFDEHHALLLGMHLDHIDELVAMEARLDAEVDQLMGPFADAAPGCCLSPVSASGSLR